MIAEGVLKYIGAVHGQIVFSDLIAAEKRHARHILFALSPGRSDSLAVIETLIRIRKELLDGADFTEILRRYPVNEFIRETDGYMVWQEPRDMLPSFEKAVGDLKPGDISEPFVSILGYHIVRVDSINYNHKQLLEGFPAYIEERLKEKQK